MSPIDERLKTLGIVCHALYGETPTLGFGDAEMADVLKAIEARSDPT